MDNTAEELDIAPKILGRDDILGADDLPRELVEVPEWDGSVWVQAMTGTERDAFEESILDIKKTGKGQFTTSRILTNIRAKLCARCIVDEEGARVFSDADMEALGTKSAKALDRVFPVAQHLNGLDAGDIDELAGN